MSKQVGKWDYKTHTYDAYDLPAGAKLYSTDMDEVVACAGCATPTTFGETYTSKTIHTSIGLGYPVCEKCYEAELSLAKDPSLLNGDERKMEI